MSIDTFQETKEKSRRRRLNAEAFAKFLSAGGAITSCDRPTFDAQERGWRLSLPKGLKNRITAQKTKAPR